MAYDVRELQECSCVPPTFQLEMVAFRRFHVPLKAGLDGLRVATDPHPLLEANAAHTTLSFFTPYPSVNVCTTSTPASEYLGV